MRLAPSLALSVALVTFVHRPLRAIAQPAPEPAPAAPEPAPPAPPSQAASVDPADVRDAYDRAFAALLRSDWPTAIVLFDDVAARSVEPERRGAARELARFARSAPARLDLDEEDRASGRVSFVASSMLASFYTGLVIDDLLGIESFDGSVAVLTGATAAGFTASLLGSRGRHISEGTAAAYSAGLVLGAGNGLLFTPVLGIDAAPDCDPDGGCPDGEISQTYLSVGLGAMAAGGIGGALLGARFEPTAPQVRFAELMAMHGIITMGAAAIFTDGFGAEDGNAVAAVLGVGLDAGLAVGITLAPRIDWSAARLTYVTLGDSLGALGGFAVAAITGSDDENVYTATIVGGLWAGFGLSTFLTRDMTPHRRYVPARTPASVVPISGRDGMRGVGLAGTF